MLRVPCLNFTESEESPTSKIDSGLRVEVVRVIDRWCEQHIGPEQPLRVLDVGRISHLRIVGTMLGHNGDRSGSRTIQRIETSGNDIPAGVWRLAVTVDFCRWLPLRILD